MIKNIFCLLLLCNSAQASFNPGNLVNECVQIEDKDTLPNLISIKDSLDYKWLLSNDIFYLTYNFENIEIIAYVNDTDSTSNVVDNFRFNHIAIFKNRYLIKEVRFFPCNCNKDFVAYVTHYKKVDGQFMMSTEFLDSSNPFYCTSNDVPLDSFLSILNFYKDKNPTREWRLPTTKYKENMSFILDFLLWVYNLDEVRKE